MSLLAWGLLYMWEKPCRSVAYFSARRFVVAVCNFALDCIAACESKAVDMCVLACACVCERVLLSVCRRGVVVAHCTVANLLCMWMRNSFPECVCFCVGENACVFLCEHVCVLCVCECVCDFALAVSEPSQLLENDFWHEAAAKTEQLRRQERNRVDGRGEGDHKPWYSVTAALMQKQGWSSSRNWSCSWSWIGMLLMDNRKRIQLAISVLPCGAIVSCAGKLIPVSPFRSRCGCLGICPVNRRRRQVAPSLNCTANPKFAARRMSKTFKMREKLAAQGISLRFLQLLVCALHKRNLLITFR